MLVAWFGIVLFSIWQLIMMHCGAGVNVWEVPKDDLEMFKKVRHPRSIFRQLLY